MLMLYELMVIIGVYGFLFGFYIVLPVAIVTTVVCSIVKSYFWD